MKVGSAIAGSSLLGKLFASRREVGERHSTVGRS